MADKEYIEREALIRDARQNKAIGLCMDDIVDVQRLIYDQPTADVAEVRHGEWEFHDTDENDMVIVKCSACGRKQYGGSNYCPNCGAKMDGKGEGE